MHKQSLLERCTYAVFTQRKNIFIHMNVLNSNTAVTAFSCPFTFRTKAYSTLYKVGHTALNFLQLPVIMGMFSSTM